MSKDKPTVNVDDSGYAKVKELSMFAQAIGTMVGGRMDERFKETDVPESGFAAMGELRSIYARLEFSLEKIAKRHQCDDPTCYDCLKVRAAVSGRLYGMMATCQRIAEGLGLGGPIVASTLPHEINTMLKTIGEAERLHREAEEEAKAKVFDLIRDIL